jgi:serralysin
VLKGFGGADILDGGDEADMMWGGTGNDRYYVDDAADVVTEYADEGIDGVYVWIDHYTLGDHVEALVLAGPGGLTGTGNDLNNTMQGNDYGNVLNGGAGVDWLSGLGSDDILDGGTGADTMVGGEGWDIFIVDDAGDVVTEYAGEGLLDMVQTGVSYSLAAGSEVEVLYADPATGAAIDLIGNEFGNFVTGNAGQNTIVGGLGIDTLRGNGGGDVFVWTSTAETLQAGDAADVVMDFNRLEGDLLALNPIDADGNGANGDTAFTSVSPVDFTSSFFTGAGQIGYLTTATDTYIFINTVVNPGVDGIDYEEATIRLAGVHTPDASWFAL